MLCIQSYKIILMKLTTKGRFAVAAMLDLAQNAKEDQPVALTAISMRQKISQAYLEQLFVKLRRADLVKSVRGSNGGYNLLRPINAITIADIVLAVEDTIDARQCNGAANCRQGVPCLAHGLWEHLNQQMENYLSAITLHDVLHQQIGTKP